MCRYAFNGPYKEHYACFSCRKVFRQINEQDLPEHLRSAETRRECRCPQCAQPMADMGLDFKAPKRTATKQWEKVRILFDHGFTFHSCGCCGPGLRPAELSEVHAFIEGHRTRSEGEALLVRIRQKTTGVRAGRVNQQAHRA